MSPSYRWRKQYNFIFTDSQSFREGDLEERTHSGSKARYLRREENNWDPTQRLQIEEDSMTHYDEGSNYVSLRLRSCLDRMWSRGPQLSFLDIWLIEQFTIQNLDRSKPNAI